ncbi:MAG: hypothetical protein KGM43_14095 [Planctomycetota bacterium]|nr:hypothetical protein [Planctomycetota bacterium]
MPSWVGRGSEPNKKRGQLDHRLYQLCCVVKRGAGSYHISKAAEKVRLSALGVIKAQRALINEYPARDPEGRQSRNLLAKEQRWLSLSVEAIVAESCRDIF